MNENVRLGFRGTSFTNHAVVVGWDNFGRNVVDHLTRAGKQVAIVTDVKDNVELIYDHYGEDKVFALFSDYKTYDLLDKVNVESAANVFINLDSDTDKLVYVINVKKKFPNCNIVVVLDNPELKNTYLQSGVTHAISKSEIASKLLASYIFEPDVATLSEQIMSYAANEDDHDLKQFKIMPQNHLIGKRYINVFLYFKKEFNIILVGISKVYNGKRKLIKSPEDEMIIESGDYLIMITQKKALKHLREIFKVEEGVVIKYS